MCNGRSDGRAVDEHDIRRVVIEGRGRAAAEGRDVIHALPLTFATDETDGVADPRGLFCTTLTARLHIIDAAATALRSLGACIARCDLDIAELVSAPMAAGLATLVADEQRIGRDGHRHGRRHHGDGGVRRPSVAAHRATADRRRSTSPTISRTACPRRSRTPSG